LERFIADTQTNGAGVNDPDADGYAPLMHALRCNHIDCMRILLLNGADTHIKHPLYRWSPLHYAVVRHHIECIKFLIGHGADINCKTRDGQTASQVATTTEIKQLIDNYVALSTIKDALDDTS
jgi:ankyrin repeat protein